MSIRKKIEIEYDIRSSVTTLYEHISTPPGLIGWFADNVTSRGKEFTFYWDEEYEKAIVLKKIFEKYIRFQWKNDEGTDYYFEWKIVVDDLTNDTALLIVDFVEDEEEATIYWNTLISDLKHLLGAV